MHQWTIGSMRKEQPDYGQLPNIDGIYTIAVL